MADSRKFYLGVDGGGTKTKAVLINSSKNIIGEGQSAGSNATIFGLTESVNQVALAVKKALTGKESKISRSCLALAGVNIKSNNQDWRQTIKEHPFLSKVLDNPLIINDTLAALRSGTTDQNAVVIIAGTGSNCYGRNEKGQEARSGGTDYILGDEGSGYNIGLKILKGITQDLDGRGQKTILTNLLFEKFKISSLEDLNLVVYQKPWNKTDIAKIAPLAEKAAEKGDIIAKKIIEQAAHDLAVMIKVVATKLNLQEKSYTIVTSGSVFNIQKILCEHLEADIVKFSPKANFIKPIVDSATAAAYLAMENNL